jgi:hypothetical protein
LRGAGGIERRVGRRGDQPQRVRIVDAAAIRIGIPLGEIPGDALEIGGSPRGARARRKPRHDREPAVAARADLGGQGNPDIAVPAHAQAAKARRRHADDLVLALGDGERPPDHGAAIADLLGELVADDRGCGLGVRQRQKAPLVRGHLQRVEEAVGHFRDAHAKPDGFQAYVLDAPIVDGRDRGERRGLLLDGEEVGEGRGAVRGSAVLARVDVQQRRWIADARRRAPQQRVEHTIDGGVRAGAEPEAEQEDGRDALRACDRS